MFEIKDFDFADEHIKKIPINSGFFVDNWEADHELMKKIKSSII